MGKGEGEGEERDGGRERGIPPASPPTPPAHRLGPRGSRGREGEESWIHILINREKGEGERRQRRGWGGVCVCGGDVTRRISRPCRGGRRRRPPACRPRRASTCPESALSPSPSLSPSLYRPRPTQERIRIRTDTQPPPLPLPPLRSSPRRIHTRRRHSARGGGGGGAPVVGGDAEAVRAGDRGPQRAVDGPHVVVVGRPRHVLARAGA